MRYTSSGAVAAFAICLAALQPALATAQSVVNDENDARAFAVREGELRREKAEAEAEGGAAKAGESVQADSAAKPDAATTKAARSAGASKALAAPAGSDGLKALVARHAAANDVPFS